MRLLTLVLSLISAIAPAPGAMAAPHIPRDGEQVLERLRNRPLDTAALEMRKLRHELARDVRNLPLATRVAQRYIEQSRDEGDPRYLGYAQAALSPWWDSPQPPPSVLLLRATIRQSNHDFDRALDDLALVLKLNPGNGQAWLTRATVHQVRGNFAQAAQSCQALLQLASELPAMGCLAGVASLTGHAARSYQVMVDVLKRNPSVSVAEKAWVETSLAEYAERLNRPEVAETHFKRAFHYGTPDPYLKGAYADFLLDSGRPTEVTRLLVADTRVDGLLLRLALAQQALDAPGLTASVAALKDRFAAARARGDRVHMREEARFTLHLLKQPQEALPLAESNWAVQKEPADARILLEAALAAGDRAAAQRVLTWMRANNLEDQRLQRLGQSLQAAK